MKIIYLSLLSAAILGQAGYCYYDYRTKAEQALIAESFRRETTQQMAAIAEKMAAIAEKTDNAVNELKESYAAALNETIQATELRSKRQLAERYAELQKQSDERVAELETLCEQTKADLAQTRAQTETQTNQVISVVNKLRLDSLGKLYDTETELVLLKKQQTSGISDQELIKRGKQKSADQFNPERN